MTFARCLRHLSAGLLLVAGLATAADRADPADDPRREVMAALFGSADAAGGYPLPEIRLDADAAPAIAGTWQGRAATLQPLAWRESGGRDARRGVLLVEATGLDDRGRPVDCHACPALLASYRVEFRDGTWQLRDNHVGFAESGAFGRAGKAAFVDLGPRRPGIAITHVGGGQGYFAEGLWLYELAGARVVARTGAAIPIAAENSGACADDDNSLAPCYAIHGRWAFDRNSVVDGLWPLVIRFAGSRPDASGKPAAVDAVATYRPQQGTYVLSDGHSPVSD